MRFFLAECATRLLQVGVVELLGYRDSGMVGTPANEDPASFNRASLDEATGRLVRLVRRYRPHVVISYDKNGSYGHPDHIKAHQITREAEEVIRQVINVIASGELHSVREYAHGESLRKVHWRSTARRGQLMVKELEDAPRDEVAVVLDADASCVTGTPPDSSFDVQVRAAGSILRAHVLRGRRSVLVVSSALAESRRIHSSDGDWRGAMELLAAVEPTASVSLSTLLAADDSSAARALELTVVTARLQPELVHRLVQRSLGHRGAALVYVDAASFASSGRPRREPALLRLQAAGVAVAVVRRGDDLAAALGGAIQARAARG